jgi:hypothetical protein
MAKAPPLRKASRKTGGKANKRPSRNGSAGKAATAKGSAGSPTRAAAKGVSGGARKVAGSSPKLAERQAMVPETPPPLPAPIASFTF